MLLHYRRYLLKHGIIHCTIVMVVMVLTCSQFCMGVNFNERGFLLQRVCQALNYLANQIAL